MLDRSFIILQSLYHMLPGIIAVFSPYVFTRRFRSLNRPIPYFPEARWSELAIGLTAGLITAYIQLSLYDFGFFRALSLYDHSAMPIVVGALIGTGATLGHIARSRFGKRCFFPFELLGAMILSVPIFIPDLNTIATIILLAIIIQLLAFFRRG